MPIKGDPFQWLLKNDIQLNPNECASDPWLKGEDMDVFWRFKDDPADQWILTNSPTKFFEKGMGFDTMTQMIGANIVCYGWTAIGMNYAMKMFPYNSKLALRHSPNFRALGKPLSYTIIALPIVGTLFSFASTFALVNLFYKRYLLFQQNRTWELFYWPYTGPDYGKAKDWTYWFESEKRPKFSLFHDYKKPKVTPFQMWVQKTLYIN
mmetsp:Transcript_42450/g.48782  ORF Transcript_42450/g.48782 Transcript_42450/m.48782 type:complete len:208 (+) Transcript_42450:29-652(+)